MSTRYAVIFLYAFLFSSLILHADVEVGVYGFVKFDLLQENRIVGNLNEISPPLVPLSDDPADHHCQTILDARSSRIGVKAVDEISDIKMKGIIEGDFFTVDGDARSFNGRHFRLRLAYAKAEMMNGFSLLVGQYWTLVMGDPEIPAPPNANTNITPVGTPISRQPQIRLGYKQDYCEWGTLLLEADVEKHGFNKMGFNTLSGGDTSQGGEQRLPLFATKATWMLDNFKWNIAVAGTQSTVIVNGTGRESSTNVWMAVSTASYKWNALTLWGTLHHCDGLSRIFSSFFFDVALNQHLDLVALQTNGGTVAARWDFIEGTFWADVIFGWDHAKTIPHTIFTGNTQETYKDIRANVFYKFWEHWLATLEYQKVLVKAYNGRKGNVDAVHLGVWYFFGAP